MNLKLISTSLGGLVLMGLASPIASASYMETCKALISEWDACRETGGDCTKQTTVIEETCKCHAQKGDEWKLVNAAVAKDGVCDAADPPVPEDINPPPADPPNRHIIDRSKVVPAEPEVRQQ